MKRTLVKLAVVLALVSLFISLFIGPGLLAAPITLLIGWWFSMVRLLKAWHPGPSGIALFVLAVIVMVVGTHGFLRWVYAYGRAPANGHAPPKWQW
jgi:hypothetical protein